MKELVRSIWLTQLKSKQKFLILFLIGFSLSVSQASAYINPGTASMVWQLMLSMFLASAYVVHLYWSRIKGAIKKKFTKSDEKPLDPA